MKKLLLSLSALLAINSLNAQIVYTNVTPDHVLTCTPTGDVYSIDFDSDGTDDITITAVSGSGLNISSPAVSKTSGNNAIAGTTQAGSGGSTLGISTPLAVNTVIGANESNFPSGTTWVDTTEIGKTFYYCSGVMGTTSLIGTWNNDTDAYLGLRFVSTDGNTYYAWVQMNVAANASTTTIRGYAYDATPDQSIVAGATSNVGFHELDVNAWSASANGKTVIVNSDLEGTVTVTTATGSIAATATLSNGTASIDLDAAAKGFYIVTFTHNGMVATKTVLVF